MQKIILDIVEKIKEGYDPQMIMLFGSYAYGKPHEDSDIDLLVVKKTAQRPIDRRVFVSRFYFFHLSEFFTQWIRSCI